MVERLEPVLLAEPAVLHPSERQLVIAVVDLVHPGHAAIDVLGGAVDLAHVVRPDRGTEPVTRVVRAPDRIVEVGVAEHRQHRPEHLFRYKPRVLARLGHHGGLEEPAALVVSRPAADQHLAAAVLDLLEQLIATLPGVDRAHAQLRLLGLHRPVARLVAANALDELGHEVVVHGVVHVHALAAEAGLAGVPVAADDDGLHRGLHIGVVAHDHRVGPAELERHALEVRAGQPHHAAAHFGGAGERHAANVGMRDEHVADLRAAPGDHVEHAVGHTRLGEQLRHP